MNWTAPKSLDSRIFLPLRSSLDLFHDPRQPPALTRAKQAAILYDRVIVEAGYLLVSVTNHSGQVWWAPPSEDGGVDPASQTPRTSDRTRALATARSDVDLPTAFAGDRARAYGAQWHSQVLGPLERLGVDFLDLVITGGGEISRSLPIGETIARYDARDEADISLMPDMNFYARNFIYSSFNRDIAVAEDLGAVLQVSTLFEPMLKRRGWQATGMNALEIAVPSAGGLTWGQVLEFRQHPGAAEARQMLRDFERAAVEEDPRDAATFLLRVAQHVADGFLAALADRRTKVPRVIAEEAAKTGISLIPVVGPFVEKTITVTQLGAAQRAERHSGIAALMKLRR